MNPAYFAISDRCVACVAQECIRVCPTDSIHLYQSDEGIVRAAIADTCIGDGRCQHACPENAPIPLLSPMSLNNAVARDAKWENDRFLTYKKLVNTCRVAETGFFAALSERRAIVNDLFEITLTTSLPIYGKTGAYATIKDEHFSSKRLGKVYSFANHDPFKHRFLITLSRGFSKHLCTSAIGSEFYIGNPQGVLDTTRFSEQDEVVLLAAGSGIAPALSIATGLIESSKCSKISLLRSARTEGHLAFNEELQVLATSSRFQFETWVSKGSTNGRYRSGRMTDHVLLLAQGDHPAVRWFAFGSRSFVHDMARLAETNGIEIATELHGGRFHCECL